MTSLNVRAGLSNFSKLLPICNRALSQTNRASRGTSDVTPVSCRSSYWRSFFPSQGIDDGPTDNKHGSDDKEVTSRLLLLNTRGVDVGNHGVGACSGASDEESDEHRHSLGKRRVAVKGEA